MPNKIKNPKPQRKRFNAVCIIFTLLLMASSCIHPMIKFRKQRLLDPMMDPAKTEGFQASFRSDPTFTTEHGNAEGSGAVGGSCPTCGS